MMISASEIISYYSTTINSVVLIWWILAILFLIFIFFSCFDRRLGIRKRYVNVILKILEYGNKKIENNLPPKVPLNVSDDDIGLPMPTAITNPTLSFEHPHPLGGYNESENGFQLDDLLPYMVAGVSSIVADSVIPNFHPEQPPMWNLLSRNNTRSYEFLSIPLMVCWLIGLFVRYLIFLPFRVLVLIIGMIILFLGTSFVGVFATGPTKRKLNALISTTCFDFVGGCLALHATFHDRENIPKRGIAVANHTTPIDSVVLSTDTCYDMVGQSQGGLLGYFMTALSRSSSHLWFDRNEAKDRAIVGKRLHEHAANPDLPPVLIFPEGVCVNNTSVMQFKKGTFEIDAEIYPIAIKFDPRFGDAFWWQDHFLSYVLSLMTSWALVCDVYYLPPMRKYQNESAAEFAKRVKSAIAKKGGLIDVAWDGFLSANPVKEEFRTMQQSAFANYILEKGNNVTPDAENVSCDVHSNAYQSPTNGKSSIGTMTDEHPPELIQIREKVNHLKDVVDIVDVSTAIGPPSSVDSLCSNNENNVHFIGLGEVRKRSSCPLMEEVS